MENTLNQQEVLEDIYGDVEEVRISGDPEDVLPKPDPEPIAPKEELEVKLDSEGNPINKDSKPDPQPEVKPINLDDAYEDEEELDENGDPIKKDPEPKPDPEKKVEINPKKRPGRKPKDEVVSRVEAIRGAAKHFADIFGVTEEQVDFDNLSETEVVSFIDQLADQLRETTYNDVKNTDKITQQMFDYKENGGDPLDILNLYKKQQDVTNVDITQEKGQRKVVESYYQENLGWSAEEVDEHIEGLVNTEKLEKEATRLKGKYDAVFEEKRAVQLENQQEQSRREQEMLQDRQTSFSQAITDSKLQKKEATALQKLAFGKGRFNDGRTVDLIDYEIAKIQRDSTNYLDFVRFVKDKEAYDRSVIQKSTNKVAEKSFEKAFNLKTGRQQEAPVIDKSAADKKKFNFNF